MVAILMSTYNGEKYLKEQIDSILCQTYKDWKLYIRDDGSIDGTIDIALDYAKQYPGIITLEKGDNIGCGYSFMHLLENVESDYFMFCDQDDVWKCDKIEKTLNEMHNMEKEYGNITAIGVFTDLSVVDQNLEVKYESFWKSNKRNPEDAKYLYRAIVNRQPFLGCTMLMNRAVKEVVFPINDFIKKTGQHDNWVMFILSVKGKVGYVNEPLIYYRQHEGNVSGYEALTLSHERVYKFALSSPIALFNILRERYDDLKLLPIGISFVKFVYYMILKWIKK